MTVVQVTPRFPPAVGGLETHVRNLAEHLHARGRGVHVLTSDLDLYPPAVRRRLDLGREEHAYRLERLRSVTVPGIAGYPLLPGLAPRLLRGAAVVHAHAANHTTVDVPLALRGLGRWPLVVSPYLSPRPGRKWRVHRAWLRRAMARADAVVVVSDWERRLLRSVGMGGPEPLVVAPITQPAPPSQRSASGPPVVLSVARLELAKGQDMLVSSWPAVLRAVPEARLVLVGPDQGARSQFESQARALSVDHAVQFTGPLSGSSLEAMWRRATVFAFPTRYETFGVTLVEAMARGVPVVASATDAVPEVAGDAALLHRKGDAEELGRLLVRALEDAGLRAELSERGRERAWSVYRPELQVDRLEEVYASVSARRRNGA